VCYGLLGVSVKEKTWIEGTEENIWTKEGTSENRMQKIMF